MNKSKLLIALTAGLFASTAVFAQANSSQGAMTPNTATSSDDSSSMAAPATTKKHKMKKTSSKMSSTGNNAAKTKTPDVTTGASAATENGQGQ